MASIRVNEGVLNSSHRSVSRPPAGTLVAFDQHAREYATWEAHPTAQSWRCRTLVHAVSDIAPAARVLDIGGGTGVDACILTALGYDAVVVEPSGGMAALATARGARVHRGRAEELLDMPDLGKFDAALSNFGALNCLDSDGLAAFGRGLACRLRPGALAVLVVMGPFCLAEAVHMLVRGRVRALARRRGWMTTLRQRAVGSPARSVVPLGEQEVPVHWWTAADLARALPAFRLEAVEALGALVPAPDLHAGSAAWRRLDARLGALPLLRHFGDHTVCVFRRLR
ncbi:MAG: class I SAM-dependent methyltransferase [Myxococcales bacterium]|nr:class I SAM-dependent methyltransferase [Myxococcales bacterium]